MKTPQNFYNKYNGKRVDYDRFYFNVEGYNKAKGDMIYYPQSEVCL